MVLDDMFAKTGEKCINQRTPSVETYIFRGVPYVVCFPILLKLHDYIGILALWRYVVYIQAVIHFSAIFIISLAT